MEIIWLMVLGLCWTIGTGMSYWEVLEDKDIQNQMTEFKEVAGNSFILMVIYCAIIAIVCALWPVWKLGGVFRMIFKKG